MTNTDQDVTVNPLMDLIDHYAELRHRAGHWTYNEKARDAREAVQQALIGGKTPLFWVRVCSDGGHEGPIHNDRIEGVRKLSGAWSPLYLGSPPALEDANKSLQDQLDEAQSSLAFYQSRCEQLQKIQSRLRDPERTIVCDILANGHLLHANNGQLDGARYQEADILVDPERRAAARRDEGLADYWRNRVSGLVEEFTTDAQARYVADRVVSALYDLPVRGIAHPDAQPAELGCSHALGAPTRDQLLAGLSKLKLRLHFMHWPAEAMWNAGTSEKPNWVPDWRYEIQLIEHLLNGMPITAQEKPSDTKPAHEVAPVPDPLRRLIAQHAALLEHNEYAYFELCYHRTTGWMAWITDKPLCMPPVVNPDRKVLAQGQGHTADDACHSAIQAMRGTVQ